MRLRDMQLVVRVADTGSMTRAAKQLHLTSAAVSGGIQRVEADLGLRLFERTTRSLSPTEEGLVVIEGCREMLARWQQVVDDATGQLGDVGGSVQLSVPADTTYGLVGDIVAEVTQQHPGLRVELDASDIVQHLHREALDVAIRYGPLPDSSLSARKLVLAPNLLVASPRYLEVHGAPTSLDELAQHRLLTLRLSESPQDVWRFVRPDEVVEVPVQSPLCGDGHLVRRWAVAGRGIAFKSLFDVIDDLERGDLVQVLPDELGETMAIHAIFPSRRRQPARVRIVVDAIAEHFTRRGERCATWLQRRQMG